MNVNLFYGYDYRMSDRKHEIDLCLSKNKEVFDNVFLINGRPTFEMVFNLMRSYPNDINVFCNSDIYFKEVDSFRGIKENECYSLTRYDLKEGQEVFFGREDSQDAWIFKGAPKNISAPFTAGLWGCDNRLAFEIRKAGYRITNPSLTIKTIHVHEIDNRNHERTKENTVSPPYLKLPPCKI